MHETNMSRYEYYLFHTRGDELLCELYIQDVRDGSCIMNPECCFDCAANIIYFSIILVCLVVGKQYNATLHLFVNAFILYCIL